MHWLCLRFVGHGDGTKSRGKKTFHFENFKLFIVESKNNSHIFDHRLRRLSLKGGILSWLVLTYLAEALDTSLFELRTFLSCLSFSFPIRSAGSIFITSLLFFHRHFLLPPYFRPFHITSFFPSHTIILLTSCSISLCNSFLTFLISFYTQLSYYTFCCFLCLP